MDVTQYGSKAIVGLFTLLIITSSAVAAPAFFDGFEDGDLSEWNNEDTTAAITTNTVFEGTYAMRTGDVSSREVARPLGSVSDPSNLSAAFQYDSGSTFRARGVPDATIDTGNPTAGIKVNSTGVYAGTALSDYTLITSSVSPNTWYQFKLYNIDYTSNTFDAEIYDAQTNSLGSVSGISFGPGASINGIDIRDDGGGNEYIDSIAADGGAPVETSSISGTVTNESGTVLENATVNVTNSTNGNSVDNTTTDSSGNYSFSLEDGSYTISVSKTQYVTKDKDITVSGSDQTVDFSLQELEDTGLSINSKQFIEHDQSIPYTVTFTNSSGSYNVSDTVVPTSNDTSLVTVNSGTLEFEATSDTSRNNITYVEATYTTDGQTFTDRRNVTVANKTVDNIGILPTGPRVSASFGDQTIQLILIATMMGAAVALFGRVFAGLGAMSLLFVMGWVGGYLGNGMVIVSFLFAAFVGLNIAANIDYTVQR